MRRYHLNRQAVFVIYYAIMTVGLAFHVSLRYSLLKLKLQADTESACVVIRHAHLKVITDPHKLSKFLINCSTIINFTVLFVIALTGAYYLPVQLYFILVFYQDEVSLPCVG